MVAVVGLTEKEVTQWPEMLLGCPLLLRAETASYSLMRVRWDLEQAIEFVHSSPFCKHEGSYNEDFNNFRRFCIYSFG